MNNLLWILFFILGQQLVALSQSNKTYKVYYEDTVYLALDNKEYNNWYVKRNELIKKKLTGTLIVFYNKELTDTAIMVNLKKGDYEGLYREWDREDGYVNTVYYYRRGFRRGICREYTYSFPKDNSNLHQDSILLLTNTFKCYKHKWYDVTGVEYYNEKVIHKDEYKKTRTEVVRRSEYRKIKRKHNK